MLEVYARLCGRYSDIDCLGFWHCSKKIVRVNGSNALQSLTKYYIQMLLVPEKVYWVDANLDQLSSSLCQQDIRVLYVFGTGMKRILQNGQTNIR